MSNTTVPISEWCKEIRVALARKEMNLQSVADEIGYSYTTITALISGRIVKDNYLDIAKKINEVLEVNVLPEKPQLPSDEWCGAVRAKLYVKKMNISELSKSIGFNRDKKSYYESSPEEKKAADESAGKLSSLHQMMIILHNSMKICNEPYDYNLVFNKNKGDALLKGYEVFEPYGWYFEDEKERQVLDGTSELYRKEKKE